MTSTVARSAVVPEAGEPESDGSSCEERENCKRLLHCDADSSGGKKRRKQTTPVRFPASLTADEREDEDDEEEEEEEEVEEDEEEDDENEENDAAAAEDSADGRPRAMHLHRASRDEDSSDEFRCRYCARLYEDKETLARHVAAEHEGGGSPSSAEARTRVHVKQEPLAATSRSESPVNLTGIGIKSFAATWLAGHAQSHGQQMRSATSNVEEWSATGPLTSISNHLQTLPFPGSLAQYLPVPSFALTDAGQAASARAPIGPAPVRIFNPDAYCDLCNKEFCNKYFLKTHKANKHGIYVDTPGQTVAESVAAIGPTSSYAGSFLANSNAKQDGQQQQQQQQHGAQLQSHQQLHHAHPHHHHHLLHHHQQQQQQHQSQQQRSAGSPSVASISLPPPSVSGSIVLSAVCDLCQKRFKNEDSVRKHKLKVHNAAVDTGLEDCETSRMLPPPPQGQQQHQSSNDADEREGTRRSPSPGAMEALFKQEFGVEQEDTGFVPAPRRMSPQSIQQARDSGFSADRLRRLGVVNPEAFCEICCKEYCNKYFLRTHKLKRHGIVVQESEKSPVNPGAAATWHHVQTSPLNLIVGETSGNGSESGGERTTAEERECKPCGTRFHTALLYHAHRRKVHELEDDGSPGRENEIDAAAVAAEQRTADSISEDLQKLQTMILQLNGLESGRGTACAVCGKEFETRAALRAHTMTEHGAAAMLEEPSSSPGRRGADDSPTPNGASSSVGCTLCEKEFPSHDALRKHLTDEHRATTPTSATAAALPSSSTIPVAPTATPPSQLQQQQQQQQPQPERRASISMTPTSSYCEICNKELCNKYFMKTHMQRMHGIEIENGAQIGGVICNICNKELCSKYFLRVHKQNTHRVVEDTAATPSTAAAAAGNNNNNNNHNHNNNHHHNNNNNNTNNNNNINNNAAKQADNDHSSGSIDDVALKPEQLGDLSHRYFTHFTEVCPICGRRFRSTKWLKAHLLGDHGKQGVDKWRELEQQYQTVPRGNSRSRGNASHPNPSLRIPNGAELAQHPKTSDYAALGNQVLSTLFGSTDDQQQANTYRCSFCSFSTPVLAFLFVHERSHPGVQGNAYTAPQSSDTDAARTTTTTTTTPPTTMTTMTMTTTTATTTTTTSTTTGAAHQCPVCLQSFSQPELLRHHLLAQHQFPGLISPSFQPSLPGSSRSDSAVDAESSKDPNDTEGRIEDAARPSTSPQISISGSSPSNDHLARSQRGEEATAVQVTPQGAYKCAQCGFATANLNRIRKHIKKDHRAAFGGDPTDTVLGELARTLRDVAGKQKLPASYAMPRDAIATTEKTIMQPFLIEESEPAAGTSEVSHQEKRFGPALVYLPVRARINAPLTTSFSLSPA